VVFLCFIPFFPVFSDFWNFLEYFWNISLKKIFLLKNVLGHMWSDLTKKCIVKKSWINYQSKGEMMEK
jgi:hypothetical protein